MPLPTQTPSQEDMSTVVQAIMDRYDGNASFLIPMMQDLQGQVGYLPKEALKLLAARLGAPLTRVYAVATFYRSFSLAPRGAHAITLCMGTVCYLKGADKVAKAIQQTIGCAAGETSADGRFSFLPVNCLGACALAPVMVVDGTYYDKVTPDKVPDILARYAAAEEAKT
jgi:NADH-quinone oxidoreductase subunit E